MRGGARVWWGLVAGVSAGALLVVGAVPGSGWVVAPAVVGGVAAVAALAWPGRGGAAAVVALAAVAEALIRRPGAAHLALECVLLACYLVGVEAFETDGDERARGIAARLVCAVAVAGLVLPAAVTARHHASWPAAVGAAAAVLAVAVVLPPRGSRRGRP